MLRPMFAALGLAALIGVAPVGPSFADSRVPFALEVENATAKVGEPTAVRATIIPPNGMKLTSVYRHRIIDLSAFENRGVEFDDEVVVGTVEADGSLVFEIDVTPTEPGAHPINGVMRVSFINGNKSESKTIPLMATVTGTE
ncbi:MAG TPA: hypothetical protein VFZ10_09210 [Geminicoccaceae bacterium]